MSEPTNTRRWRTGRATAATGALAVLVSIAGFTGGRAVTPVAAQITTPIVKRLPARTADAESSYSGIVKKVAPAVVTIRVEARASPTRVRPPGALREFFGRQLPEGFGPFSGDRQVGLGSGVVIRPDGYVLTNSHVIAGADRVRVELGDRRSFDATVVGSDAASDVAVLKVDANGLSTVHGPQSSGKHAAGQHGFVHGRS